MKDERNPLVTVLLPFFREDKKLFEESVSSILYQTHTNLEIILLCDDPANQQLLRCADSFCDQDKRVRLEVNNRNRGLTFSLNKGIDLANGAFICRMDADDISSRSRIEKQVSFLRSQNLDLVGGNVEVIDECGRTLYKTNNPSCPEKTMAKALAWNNCIPHPTWLGKRDVFSLKYRNVPLCEDYDFLLRSSLAGKKLGLHPDVILKYRMTSSSISRSNMFEQYLSQRFLTKSYKRGEEADLADLSSFVERHANPLQSSKYSKANLFFNEALEHLSSGRIAKGLTELAHCSLTSPYYVDKARRLCLAAATLKLNKQ